MSNNLQANLPVALSGNSSAECKAHSFFELSDFRAIVDEGQSYKLVLGLFRWNILGLFRCNELGLFRWNVHGLFNLKGIHVLSIGHNRIIQILTTSASVSASASSGLTITSETGYLTITGNTESGTIPPRYLMVILCRPASLGVYATV